MARNRIAVTGVVILLSLVLGSAAAQTQLAGRAPRTYALWNFDEQNHTCRMKGRLQDRDYCASHTMDRIIADGKEAIPILVSELTGTRPTSEPIYDYWRLTTEGDVAYFILMDLFLDSDWHTFHMPGVESVALNCNDIDAETCWRGILKKHGRRYVQEQWRNAWAANKGRAYWDEQARCFKLTPQNESK